MEQYSFALSDELCEQYYAYKDQKEYDKEIVNKLLKFRLTEFVTNADQLSRSPNAKNHGHLINQLRRAGLKGQTLEQLADKTIYKLVLSTNRSDYPYLNINDDSLDIHLIGCYYRDSKRDKALLHVKGLCEKSKIICLYDQYLKTDLSYKILLDIIPNKNVTVKYQKDHLTIDQVQEIATILNKVNFAEQTTMLTHHDRYLILDDEIEVILSSGFRYLSCHNKELSYIVRPIVDNRLYK